MSVRLVGVALAIAFACLPGIALAHGTAGPAPTAWILLTRWEVDPLFFVGVGISTWLYVSGARRVNALHPRSPWPRRRTAFFLSGVGVLVFALVSPFASYDTDLFSLHMWQHLLITMVAAPLLLLGTPVTLALRVATPAFRRRVLLPLLHSRPVRVVTFPIIPWLLFTVVMWGSHFSPVYNQSLEHAWVHQLEHTAYLVAALLFWWEVIGIDPTPWRMHFAVRALYVFLQMPQSSFLAVSIYGADHVLYAHYATLQRSWGPSPLLDQEIAGVTMWITGDMMFLLAVGLIIAAWMRSEDRAAKRGDARRDMERARALAAEQARPQSG